MRAGVEDFPFYRRAGACPPPCGGLLKPREGQALALRYRRVSVYRRAGACPPPCGGLPKPREGQALALRYGEGGWRIGRSRGTGPRATVWGRRLGPRTLARDRPSRYRIGKVIGPSDAREGQALALRYGVTHRDREVSPTGKNRRAGACPPRSLWNPQRVFTN